MPRICAYNLYVKKFLGTNLNSTSIKQQCNRSLMGEVLEEEMVCLLISVKAVMQNSVRQRWRWGLILSNLNIPCSPRENLLIQNTWTTFTLQCMNRLFTHEYIKNEGKLWKIEYSVTRIWFFQEDYKFHLIIILVVQNSLQLYWYKYSY